MKMIHPIERVRVLEIFRTVSPVYLLMVQVVAVLRRVYRANLAGLSSQKDLIVCRRLGWIGAS